GPGQAARAGPNQAVIAKAAQLGATPQVDMLTVTEGRPRAEVADRLGVADDAEVVVRSRRYRTPRTHRSDQDAQTNAGEVVRQFQTMCTTVASELHGTR